MPRLLTLALALTVAVPAAAEPRTYVFDMDGRAVGYRTPAASGSGTTYLYDLNGRAVGYERRAVSPPPRPSPRASAPAATRR